MEYGSVNVESLYIVNYYSMKEGHRFKLVNAKSDEEAQFRANQFIKDEIRRIDKINDCCMYLWLSKAIKKE